jgi:hypothetical protein
MHTILVINKAKLPNMSNNKKTKGAKRGCTEEEFARLAHQHALNNADRPGYKYLNTPQPTDFRFDTYLNICIEAADNNTVITVTDKDPRFKLEHVMLSVKNVDEIYSLTDRNKTLDGEYVLRIEKNLTGTAFEIWSSIQSVDENSGLLDMELEHFDITL